MSQRLCTLTSPLGDALRFSRMHVCERMNGLFTMSVEAVSTRHDIAPSALLGKAITVTVRYPDEFTRHFHGYVTRIAIGRRTERDTVYQLTAHPWLWFLTRTADCRIFQKLALPDVIAQVFADEPAAAFDDRLADRGRYEPWDYCVQYRETDFNFVSRLLEQEGIGYCFEHDQDRHTLVLIDSKDGHRPIDAPPGGSPTIPYVPDGGDQAPEGDYIDQWQIEHEIQPGQIALDDYDFTQPGTDLAAIRRAENAPEHPKADYEVYDYPGEHDTVSEGETYAANRIEELHGQARVFEGGGQLRSFQAGRSFKLSGHPRKEQNTDYLLVSVDTDIHEPAWDSGANEPATFRCRFTAIPKAQQYRPPRTTPRPVVQGIQTAVVTGPDGDEIHTDEHGRIRVKFPWDRSDTTGEKTSCWLRVAFLAAGPGFGFVSIPRIGHEVVVDFLEGDPDRPLVTGVVYNGDNRPPWALPANKTQSGLLTRSSLGGGADNANAIRFEDKKGSEEVWIHAEKDQRIEVEHDESHTVGHDRKKTVDHDETTVIGNNRTETVVVDETVTIGAHRSHTIGATDTLKVALQRTHLVGANETIGIIGAQEIGIGAAQVIAVGLAQSTKVGANQSTTVIGKRSVEVHGNQSTKIGKDHEVNIDGKEGINVAKDQQIGVVGERKTSIGKDDTLTVAKHLVIDAGDSVTIKTGSASIVMKKDGTITISGAGITIEGSKDVTVKAPKVTTDGSAKNVVNGAMVEVTASGVNTIKGSLVKIN